jgi:probable phosphoglycerate mutase
VRGLPGNVALFAHGHVLRVLAARWLGLDPGSGRHFLLDTATVSVLSSYRGFPALKHWNVPLLAVDSEELMRRLEESRQPDV